MAELLYKDEVYAFVGAAMEVYNTLGPGFAEPVYQEALGIELGARKILAKAQQELPIFYKNIRLQKIYLADFIAYDKIVVEIKALEKLSTKEEAQLLNYLKATGHPLGLLINFGALNDLEWKRMAATQYRLSHSYHARNYIRED